MEPPLTPTELAIGKFGLNRDIAYKAIMNDYERSLIWRALLFDGEGWNLKSLSDHIKTDRATTSRKVKLLIERGFIEKRDGGFYLTPWGRDFLLHIFRNGLRIANGEQSGWPEDIIAKAKESGHCWHNAGDLNLNCPINFELN